MLITWEPPKRIAQWRLDEELPYPVLQDPGRSLYAAFGLRRGRFWRVWSPGTLAAYVRSILAGTPFHRPVGDLDQLGGDVVLDSAGRVRFIHASREPIDRPPVTTLLDALRGAATFGEGL